MYYINIAVCRFQNIFDVCLKKVKPFKPFLSDIFVLSDVKVILQFTGESVKFVQNGILM